MAPTVIVYILDNNGMPKVLAKGVDKTKLVAFSRLAAERLGTPSQQNQRFPSHSLILYGESVDADAAGRILQWIESNDASAPKPMTLAGFGIVTFGEAVAVHYTTNYLFIDKNMRGNEIRDAIYEYSKQSPLSYDEFGIIVEYLHFDLGLVKTAKHQVMHGKVKGGQNVPPDMARIEEYCKKNGMWEEMCAIEAEIVKKTQEYEGW